MHVTSPEHGQDQARKPGSGSDIEHGTGRMRQQAEQLGAVEKVPAPDLVKRRCGNQVDGPLPPPKHRFVAVQFLHDRR